MKMRKVIVKTDRIIDEAFKENTGRFKNENPLLNRLLRFQKAGRTQ